MIENKERDQALICLDSFIRKHNEITDEDLDFLFSTAKTENENNFKEVIENNYQFILESFKKDLEDFMDEFCQIKLSDFSSIDEARDFISSFKIYKLLKQFSLKTFIECRKTGFKAGLRTLTDRGETEFFKQSFIYKFNKLMDEIRTLPVYAGNGRIMIFETLDERYENLDLLHKITKFVNAVEMLYSKQSFNFEVYFNPKEEKFSFGYGKMFDSVYIGSFSIGITNGKVNRFQKKWLNNKVDLNNIVRNELKSFLMRKYKFISTVLTENNLKWEQIINQKIPLCVISESKLSVLTKDFESQTLSSLLSLANENSPEQFEKILNLIRLKAKEKFELSAQYK